MTTATKESKTAKTPDQLHREMRAGLQQRLKDRDKFKAELDAAAENLKEAQRAVDEFERPRGYIDQFETAWTHKARVYNDLSNSIPQELQNSCKDSGLRAEFGDARACKCDAARHRQSALDASRNAEQELDNLRARLTRGRDGITRAFGEPEILNEGDELPWSSSAVVRAGLRVATAVGLLPSGDPILWVIRGDVITFRPGAVGAADIEADYVRNWSDRCREVRHSQRALAETDARLKVASDALEVVRQKLIWSAV